MINTVELKEAFTKCLFQDGEDTTGYVQAIGITNNFGFHPERLESTRDQVKEWLAMLSDDFMKGKGGGMSFLNACIDRNGQHWGEHVSVEHLMVLGVGLGMVTYCIPKEAWAALPGGMPYFVVDLKGTR